MINILEEIRLNEFGFKEGFNCSNPYTFDIFHPKLYSLVLYIHLLSNLLFATCTYMHNQTWKINK